MEDEVVKIIFADAVAFGALLGQGKTDPYSDDKQDHMTRRRKEVAEECEHIISGSVRCGYEEELQPWGRQ